MIPLSMFTDFIGMGGPGVMTGCRLVCEWRQKNNRRHARGRVSHSFHPGAVGLSTTIDGRATERAGRADVYPRRPSGRQWSIDDDDL